MTGAALDLGWQALVAVLFLAAALAFVAVVWLTRAPRSHRVRLGVFLERDDDEHKPAGD